VNRSPTDPGGKRARAAVALGSNLGDRRRHLDLAVEELRSVPGVRVLSVSSWIETAAVGGPAGSPPYLNGAVLLETELGARELLEALLSIERGHGRRRNGVRDEPRTLDLDLLLFGDEALRRPGLVVPHPRLAARRFVLAPLAELCPGRVVPGTGLTVAELLARAPEDDAAPVGRYPAS
jgi:2-amino-4-hydroxy-6-hydroxymethyldihydropteridine diphosphokinase